MSHPLVALLSILLLDSLIFVWNLEMLLVKPFKSAHEKLILGEVQPYCSFTPERRFLYILGTFSPLMRILVGLSCFMLVYPVRWVAYDISAIVDLLPRLLSL